MTSKPSFVEVILTCGSWQEAHVIAETLLHQRLVACVEFLEVESSYRWKEAIEQTKEIKLIMETVAHHFEAIEREVAKVHSYDTFVLQQIPLTNLSDKAQAWWSEETKQG